MYYEEAVGLEAMELRKVSSTRDWRSGKASHWLLAHKVGRAGAEGGLRHLGHLRLACNKDLSSAECLFVKKKRK